MPTKISPDEPDLPLDQIRKLKADWQNARAERAAAVEASHALNWQLADDAMQYLEKQLVRLILEDES